MLIILYVATKKTLVDDRDMYQKVTNKQNKPTHQIF